MPHRTFVLVFSLLLFGLFIASCFASIVIIKDVRISIGDGHYITMGKTIVFPSETLVYGNGLVLDNGDWINSTVDLTLSCWIEENWLNYTVSSAGTQQVHNGTEPWRIWIDNVLHLNGDGWSFAGGTVTVTHATSSVRILWHFPVAPTAPNPVPLSWGYTSAVSQSLTQFSSSWVDDVGLSTITFGCNATGAWYNETLHTVSGLTASMTSDVYAVPHHGVVRYQFWANDTDNNWNTTMIQTLRVVQPGAPWTPRYPSLLTRSLTDATWYFCNSLHTLGNTTTYTLNETQTAVMNYAEEYFAGDVDTQWGFRFWLFFSDNSSGEISAGYPTAIDTRLSTGSPVAPSSLQVSIWRPDRRDLQVGLSAIMVKLYVRGGSSAWQLKGTFTTDFLKYQRLEWTNWTISLYTRRTENATFTYTYARFGIASANSNIVGIQFQNAWDWEMISYYLNTGNLVMAAFYGYIAKIGNMIWSIIVLIICSSMWVRFRSTRPILISFTLLAGSGANGALGVFNILSGEYGGALVSFVALFTLAGLLYSVFR